MYKVKVQLKIKTQFHCIGHCIARTTSNQYSKFQVSSPKKSRDVVFKNTLNSGPLKMGVVNEIGAAVMELTNSHQMYCK